MAALSDANGRTASALRRLVQMGLAFSGSDIVRGGLRLVMAVAIARDLGRDAFGWWTAYSAAAGLATMVCDLGFGVWLTREAARAGGPMGPLVSRALAARLTLCVAIAGGCGVAIALGLLPIRLADAAALAVLVGAGVAYGAIAPVFRTSPRSLAIGVSIETAATAIQVVVTLLAAAARPSLTLCLSIAALAQVLQLAAVAAYWWRARPRDRFERPSLGATCETLRRALPFAAAGLVANVQARLAPLVVGAFSGSGEVAALGVAARIEGVARRVPSAAFGAALPVFAAEDRDGRSRPIRVWFDRLLIAFTACAAIAMVLGASALVRLTFGAGFDAAVRPLAWSGLVLLPSLSNASRRVYLNATGRERIALWWSAAALLVQGAASLVLIPLSGAVGAIWSIGLGESVAWIGLRRAAAERRERRAAVIVPARLGAVVHPG